MTAPEIRDSLLEGHWRQGSLLPDLLHEHVRWHDERAELPDGAVVAVISQDCDLLHDSVEHEPVIEVVAGSRVDSADSNNFHAKNPRRLDINVVRDDGSSENVRLEMRWRGVVDRAKLFGNTASPQAIRGHDLRTLSKWLSRRYERPALPDAFNRRLDSKGGLSRLRRLLRKGKRGQPLGVFVALGDQRDQELPESLPYKVALVVVLAGTLEAGEVEWDEFETNVFDPVVRFFKRIDGFELVHSSLVSEHILPYRQKRVHLVMLDLDSVSLASEGESAVPDDG